MELDLEGLHKGLELHNCVELPAKYSGARAEGLFAAFSGGSFRGSTVKSLLRAQEGTFLTFAESQEVAAKS